MTFRTIRVFEALQRKTHVLQVDSRQQTAKAQQCAHRVFFTDQDGLRLCTSTNGGGEFPDRPLRAHSSIQTITIPPSLRNSRAFSLCRPRFSGAFALVGALGIIRVHPKNHLSLLRTRFVPTSPVHMYQHVCGSSLGPFGVYVFTLCFTWYVFGEPSVVADRAPLITAVLQSILL